MTHVEPLVDGQRDDMHQQVHPVQLSWADVCYTVKVKKDDKQILKNISGHAEPGTFTAILGASGSGKTSLLSVLADRLLTSKGATLTGQLKMNGEQAPSDYRTRCAFVQQVEVFYPFSTVGESVEMASRMRLGRHMNKAAKKARAVEVIHQMGLTKTIDTKVGDGGRIKGISGGEMKRVGIACELVSSPSLLMLDEPTSGLDSNAALNVVRSLKSLAGSGRNIIASIHQPGSAIFAEFDNVIVLAEGTLQYFGPANHCSKHFNQIGYECPSNFNPADFMLMITSIDYTSPESENESRQQVEKINSSSSKSVPAMLQFAGSGPGPAIENQTTYFEQFTLLYRRIWLDAIRNKVAVAIKFGQGIISTLLMILLFGKMRDVNNAITIQMNVTALLFFITTSGLFGPLFGTIQAFAPEVNIVIRERMNNLYAVGPYYLAKLFVAVPMELAPLLVGNTFAFWCLDFTHSVHQYFMFLLFACGMTFASVGIGFVVAVAAGGNVQAASAAVAPIALLMLLLGGFYVNPSTIPVWISWLSKLEYMRFVYEGLAINEFNGEVLAADKSCINATSGACSTLPRCGGLCIDDVLGSLFAPGQAKKTEREWEAIMWKQFLYVMISICVFWSAGYFVLLTKGPKYLVFPKLPAKDVSG